MFRWAVVPKIRGQTLLRKLDRCVFQKKLMLSDVENYDVSIGMMKYSNTLQVRLWLDLVKVSIMTKWKSDAPGFNTSTRVG